MKSIVKIALGVAALAFVQPAAASTQFTITGSTAFRAGLYDTIVALMGGTPASNVATCKISTTAANANGATPTAAQGRSAVNAANTVTFVGSISGINGGSPVTIYCSMSGSATGLIAIYNSTTLTYASAAATTAGYDHVAYSNTTPASSATTTPGAAQFAMSDVFQSSVTTTSVTGLNENTVAVVPFVLCANKGSTLTGLTAQNVRLLLNNGAVQQSNLTGNPSDTTNVYMTGRDNGSGTRITTLAETKFGITSNVQQYYGVTSGAAGSGTITSLQLWPTSGIANFDPINAGNGGYGSGGTIATLLGFTGGSVNILNADGSLNYADTNVSVVGYLGAGDANTAVGTNGAVRLTYEGKSFLGTSDTTSVHSVQNGGYTLWCYEHLSYNGTPAGDELALINAVKGAIISNLGANGIDPTTGTSMQVSRSGDGALVGP